MWKLPPKMHDTGWRPDDSPARRHGVATRAAARVHPARPTGLVVLAVLAGAVLAACGHRAGPVPHVPAAPALLHLSAVTGCGSDGHGQCPSLGGTTTVQPAPAVVGRSTEVNLGPFLNSDAVTSAAAGLRFGGLGGGAFAEATFPSSGNLTLHVAGGRVVTFLIPAHAPGVRSAVRLDRPVQIPLPRGVYATMWLLGAGAQGTFGPLNADVAYADGTAAAVPLTFRDWCNDGRPLRDDPPESVGIAVPYVLGPEDAGQGSEAAAGPAASAGASRGATAGLRTLPVQCGLWAEGIALPAGHAPLVGVTLPQTPSGTPGGAYLMAVTLNGVAAAPD